VDCNAAAGWEGQGMLIAGRGDAIGLG
jgi:hypothetical protein